MGDVKEFPHRNGSHPPLEMPPEAPKGPSLFIELMPDGSVLVTGPINNQLLCYGLLEGARDVIKDYKASSLIRG